MEGIRVICHMMMSLDGRIDCAMTTKLTPSDIYYELLDALSLDSTLSGKTTARLEMAQGDYLPKSHEPLNRSEVFKAEGTKNRFSIVCDTKGSLKWEESECDGSPLLILTSEKASREYLDYLRKKNISYIAVGKERIDLKKGVEILRDEFEVRRLGIVGGGTINGAFLKAGLLDEISILIGPGIDGRKTMGAVFDGLSDPLEVKHLHLKGCQAMKDESVLLTYEVLN